MASPVPGFVIKNWDEVSIAGPRVKETELLTMKVRSGFPDAWESCGV